MKKEQAIHNGAVYTRTVVDEPDLLMQTYTPPILSELVDMLIWGEQQ